MSGKYHAYPKYRSTDIEWLGDVPSHWQTDKFKYLFSVSDEKNGTNIVGEMLSVSGYRGIEIKEYDDEGKKRTEEELVDYRVVRPGQLVVNTMWLNYAGLGVSEHEGYVSPAYRAYWISERLNGRYCHHLLRSAGYVAGYTKYMQGIRPNSLQIKTDDFNSFPVLYPPIEEQRAIAEFLDHETAKIDRLIEKQHQLIELLKEKRQAVISHAVTKGLDPNVKMKDSGVEWLGEVPIHWEVTKLKYLIKDLESGVSVNAANVPADDDEFGVLKTSCVYTRVFRGEENKTVLEEEIPRLKCPVRKGAIIISRMNTPDLVGASAHVEQDYANLYLPDRLWQTVFFNDEKQIAKYVNYFMMLQGFRDQISNAAEGASSSMQNIAKEDYLSIFITLPPIDEQRSILGDLDSKLAVINALHEKCATTILLLTERRTALISAGVTGKIDVRHWRAKTQTAA